VNADKVNYYEACDKAIKIINRELVEEFGKLKLADFDKINVIRTVTTVYQTIVKRVKKKYYEIAFEAYILGMMVCGEESTKAHRKADKAITMAWVEDQLNQTDFVTLYRFYNELERKVYKLAETLEVTPNRNREIDKAMRYLSQQLGQYCINFTDYAVIKAFQDYGAEMVEWISERDNRVCNECYALNGQVFPVRELPRKPHWGCRCRWKPVFRTMEAGEVANTSSGK